MKVHRKSFRKDGDGDIELTPEHEEDLWHVFNLVREGDKLRATTTRKVQVGPREEQTERVRLNLTIQVVSVDYDGASECRCKGTCCSENRHIPLGSFHSIVLEPGTKLTLSKECWDALDIRRIDEAAEPATSSDLAVVLITEGIAHVCLIGKSSTSLRSKIQVALPKKRGAGSAKGYNDSFQKFLQKTYEAVVAHVNLEVVKCLLIAGPGFAKDSFREYLLESASRTANKELMAFKQNIVTAQASTAYLQGIEEILANSAMVEKIANTRAIAEVKALDEFFQMLSVDSSRAFYGPGHVIAAAEQGAVGKLLIADSLYRVHSVKERKRWVALVESVQSGGGEVFIFSTQHQSGKQLKDFTGIAAILRFPMPELEEEDPVKLLAALEISS